MPVRRELALGVALFVATLTTIFLSWRGIRALQDPAVAWDALAYTGALAAILLAHEFAHYAVAVRHGFRLSLPFFLPFPLGGFGTLGAVILLRSPPPNRTALLEMGAAGPCAGAVVSFVALAFGLRFTGPDVVAAAGSVVDVLNDPLAVELLGRLVAGAPPGRFAALHPVALAGWVGCFLTALNLIPLGQSDGGHILGSLFPRQAVALSRVVLGVLVLAGFLWPGWAFWAGLALLSGAWRNVAVPLRPPLTRRALALALCALLALTLTLMPIPIEPVRMPESAASGPAAGAAGE